MESLIVAKICFFPLAGRRLRAVTDTSATRHRPMLVILRMTIGYSLLSEGTEKSKAGFWEAKPFFRQRERPVCRQFRENGGGITNGCLGG